MNTPTFVPTASPYKEFASGGALFGEKGPEAILPIKRTSTGQLGVIGSGSPNIEINVVNNTGTETTATQKQPKWDGTKWVIGVVLDAMNRNTGGFRTNLKTVVAT